jgi:hypothetical protein
MLLFIHGVGNRQINRRKPIRLRQSAKNQILSLQMRVIAGLTSFNRADHDVCREACAELSRAKSTAAAIGAWTMRKSDSRCRNRARPRRAGLLAVSKFEKHSWRRGAPLHPSEQDDFALSLTLSQIGGDPTTVRNEAMNAVTFAGGSASALST